MKKIHLYLFFIFFIALSLVEGFRWILDMRFMVFILYCMPIFLFILDGKKEYKIPSFFVGLSVLYLLFTYISVLNSKNRGVSYELFFRDVSFFLIAVYSHAHSEIIKKHLPKTIIFLSLIFITSSLVLLLIPVGRDFISGIRLNLLFNPFYPHKTIGDYLVFGILIAVYSLLVHQRRWGKYILWIFVPIYLLSFSRSAYIALVLTFFLACILYREKIKKMPFGLLFSIVLNILLVVLLFFVFATKREGAFITSVQNVFQNAIYPRSLLMSRIPFWLAGIRGFFLAPFSGIGPGTFEYISFRFTNHLFLWSNTSFNLIIDILAEQGIFSAVSFLCICIYIFITAKKKNVFFLLFTALFIGFMGFSTYSYFQIRLLFFIVMGVLLQSKKDDYIIQKKFSLLLSGVAVVFVQLLFLHTVYVRANMRELAHVLYPYDRENLKILIGKERWYVGNEKKIYKYLVQFDDYFGIDPVNLEYLGDVYASMDGIYNKKKAIYYYEQSFVWGKYNGGNIISRMAKLFVLKRKFEGETNAQKYIKNIVREYGIMLQENNKHSFDSFNQTTTYKNLKKIYDQ